MAAGIKHTRDTTANDSDKVVLTSPTGKICKILQLHIDYTSTATVGNRQILMSIYDENDVIVADYHAGAVQAASLTRHYVFAQGVFRETSFVDGSIQCPFPFDTILLPGWYVRVYDSAAVDAAADDMTVDVLYKEAHPSDTRGL